MEASAVLALCISLFKGSRGEVPTPLPDVPGILPLLLLLVYSLFQLLPLPPGLLKVLSPGTYALYRDSIWIADPGRWVSLSLNVKGTIAFFFRYAAYTCVYILAIQLQTDRRALRKMVTGLVVFGACLAFFGILPHLLPNNRLYWFRELTKGGVPFGPYVNRNHYAGLIGMIVPLAISGFLYYRPEVTQGSLRKQFLGALTHYAANRHMLFGFAAVLMATSVFVSLSRGGIVSLCIAMIFSGALIMTSHKQRRVGVILILVFVAVLYSVGWFGWSPIFERFEDLRNSRDEISEFRLEIWKDSLGIVKDFPLTGTGFGSYITIYPQYRTISAPGIVDHAHNDYIELLADGGIIAVILAVWFLSSIAYRSAVLFLKQREPFARYLFIGSLTGIVSILVHSMADFNLQIGANGLYLFLLSGLLVSGSHAGLPDGSEGLIPARPRRMQSKPALLCAVSVLTCCLGINLAAITGKYNFSFVEKIQLDAMTSAEDRAAVREIAQRAVSFDPLEPSYHFTLANAEWVSGNTPAAVEHYKKAVRLNPLRSEYLQGLGLALSGKETSETADKLFKAGINVERQAPQSYRRYGSWLLSKGERARGVEAMSRALLLEPGRTRDYISLMVLYGFGDSEISDALPRLAEPHLIFADFLEKTGSEELAAQEYTIVRNLLSEEKGALPSQFYRVYQYYMRKGLADEAIGIMKNAVELFPGDVRVRLTAAAAYEKAGDKKNAVESYRQALVLDPKNQSARKKLETLQ